MQSRLGPKGAPTALGCSSGSRIILVGPVDISFIAGSGGTVSSLNLVRKRFWPKPCPPPVQPQVQGLAVNSSRLFQSPYLQERKRQLAMRLSINLS
jgi:hypothetical protein